MKKNKWAVFKQMMKAGMFISILFVGMQVGALWNYYKDAYPSGNAWQFITHKESAEYDILTGEPPERIVKQVELYNNTSRAVWFALFFFAMLEIFAYLEEPKGHWFRYVKKKFDKTIDIMEKKESENE